MKPWIKKLAQIGLDHPELREDIRYIVEAAYSGNPDGKPIYDHEIDHGYDEPLSGGSDVMRRMQNQFRKEQGLPERPSSPQVPKTAEGKPEAGHLRKPFYEFSDGVIGFTHAARGLMRTDPNLKKLVDQANKDLDRITRYLNSHYIWD